MIATERVWQRDGEKRTTEKTHYRSLQVDLFTCVTIFDRLLFIFVYTLCEYKEEKTLTPNCICYLYLHFAPCLFYIMR